MSKFFRLEELLHSETARRGKFENLPSFEIVDSLKRLAEEILDPLREEMGCAVNVSSGFRSKKLNDVVKGAKGSQHMKGEAADIYCKDNRRLFDTAKRLIEEGRITVGQLIWEKGNDKAPDWVHISLPNANHKNDILYLK